MLKFKTYLIVMVRFLLLNGISTFLGYLMPKPPLLNRRSIIKPKIEGVWKVHIFHKVQK